MSQRSPVSPHPERVVFHVRDTGIGIPADRLDRLFKPFSQVDSSITRTHGGTGLGLAISRRLVAAMGGEIGVASEPGHGTDFHFSVPAKAVEPGEEARLRETLSDKTIEQALRGRRILVVDDYAANRQLFEKLFEPYGAMVTAVESAEAARRALALQPFDLGIFDYMMPAMDGISLARIVASSFPAMRLMLVTSVHLSPNERAPELFAAVVTKPVRNRKFLIAVASVLLGKTVAAEHIEAAPAPSTRSFGLQHALRILAIDDNPVNLKVISMTLTSLGYAPVVLDSGLKALERLRTEPFDLVLTDVQMPDLDGLEVARRLRRGDAGPLNRHTRVLALTAGATSEEREACRAAGMDDFIPKPISRDNLLEKLIAAAETIAVAKSSPSG